MVLDVWRAEFDEIKLLIYMKHCPTAIRNGIKQQYHISAL